MDTLLFALWFFLPAGIANAAPILTAVAPLTRNWNRRMDFGGKYRGKEILGAHKTWRGLFTGIAAAILTVYIQQLVFQNNNLKFLENELSNYLHFSPVILGILFGGGALIGDAVESFFKRQVGIRSGGAWFPFDQIDYIIGGCLAVAIVVTLPLTVYFAVLITWFFMHLIFSYIGYLLHMKSQPI